ncbi:MAG: FG-GAP-like repeat-containing protein [Candidatus Zixiibacteriota bacterium]
MKGFLTDVRSRAIIPLGILLALTLFMASAGFAATRYVPAQYGTIQAAIDASSSGDLIIVSSGVYYGAGNVNVSFSGKDVYLVSASGPASTIIDCDSSGTGNRAFEFTNSETSSAHLDGFTIRDGNVRYNAGTDDYGGAIRIESASPTISNCIFENNQAFKGGAVYCAKLSGYPDNVYPTFEDCIFFDNYVGDTTEYNSYGGAVYMEAAHPEFTDCLFYDNSSDGYGGSVFMYSGTGEFTSCTFDGSESYDSHGGTFTISDCDVDLDRCIISNTIDGFGIVIFASSAVDITCCDFWNNYMLDTASIMGTFSIDANTIFENPAYCDIDNDDYTIVETSPCAADYSPCGQLIGVYGVDCDAPIVTYMYPPTYLTYAGYDVEVISGFAEEMDSTTFSSSSFKVFSRTSGQEPGDYLNYVPLKWYWFEPDNSHRAGEVINYVLTSDITNLAGHPIKPFAGTYLVRTASTSYGYIGDETRLATGDKPVGVFPADLDGDGDIDLAVPNHDSHNISVFMNDGTGSFGAASNFSSGGYNPWDVTSRDFDGDGDMDLATSNYGSNTVSVYLNNGSGSFTNSNNYAAGNRPHPILSEDIDADGDFDLMTVNLLDDSICVYLNNGNATFQSKVTYYVGDGPIGLSGADYDRDGDIDIFTANYYESTIGLLENNGDGTFAAVDTLTIDATGPFNVIAVDMNYDGYVDLATANRGSDDVSVLIQQYGVFDSVVVYDAGTDPYYVCAADLNGDWRVDLITANLNSDDLSLYLNNGSGNFGTEMRVPAGNGPLWVCAADFDEDLMVDVAAANAFEDEMSIYYNVLGGPEQTSPANGYQTTDHAITLDWEDYTDAVTYEVVVDNDPAFGSIDRQATGLNTTYWAINPQLGHGKWYWKVRAILASDTSRWSYTWSFNIIGVPGVPSCPVLFTFDGAGFVKDNPLLTACEKSGYTDIVTDYYHVGQPVKPNNGEVTFQLREMEDETTYLYDVELLAVDHKAGSFIACTPEGDVSTYSTTYTPIAAVDNNGVDQLALVSSEDNARFVSNESGWLEITFQTDTKSAVSGGIVLDTPPKKFCFDPDQPVASQDDPRTDDNIDVLVEYKDAGSSWTELPALPPRSSVGQDVLMLPSASNQFTIRITWDDRYSTDIIRYFVLDEEKPIVSTHDIAAGTVTIDKKASDWTGFEKDKPLVLNKGDMFEFAFKANELSNRGMERDYIIRAVGRYEPDYSIFTDIAPNRPQLHGNYPNPFNPITTISYDLPTDANVRLEIYNILGQQVRLLVNGTQSAGTYDVVWDSKDNHNQAVASGMYFYRLTVGDYTEAKKMLLLK